MSHDESVWQEVYERIKDEIESGQLPENSECPKEEDLRRRYSREKKLVSRGTIRRAVSQLVQDDYLEIRPGKQRIIRKPDPVPFIMFPLAHIGFGRHLEEIAQREGWPKEFWPDDEVICPPISEAWYHIKEPRLPTHLVREAFSFDSGKVGKVGATDPDQITWLMRARRARKRPLVLQWVVVPKRIIPHIPRETLKPGGLTFLYHQNGITRHSYRATYRPTRASSDEGRHLRVETGTPLIEERRVSYYVPGEDSTNRGRKIQTHEMVPYELLVTLWTERMLLGFEFPQPSETSTATSDDNSRTGPGKKKPARKRKTTRRSSP